MSLDDDNKKDASMTDMDDAPAAASADPSKPIRQVPIAWEALEDAFENNAPEVHSYLQLDTGEVIRIVDGIADPQMHTRVANDAAYLRVEPVSSREQYRWMERFIATVEESEFRDKLVQAIDGKGAFRRFKDVLMSYPLDRERWFAFRSERLRSCMEGWLGAHAIEAVQRQQWRVPTADEVRPAAEEADKPARRNRAALAEAHRRRLHELADLLPARELDAAVAFLEFLRERKHLPRPRAKSIDADGDHVAGDHVAGDHVTGDHVTGDDLAAADMTANDIAANDIAASHDAISSVMSSEPHDREGNGADVSSADKPAG